MKYLKFYRESDDFSDILNDVSIKKHLSFKIKWPCYLLVGISESKGETQVVSLITLKYGDSLRNRINKDFTPVPWVDYQPKDKLEQWKRKPHSAGS